MPNPRVLIFSPSKSQCQQLTIAAETLGFYTLALSDTSDSRKDVRQFKPDVILVDRQIIKSNLLDFLLRLPGRSTLMVGLITDDAPTIQLIEQTQSKQIQLLPKPVDTVELGKLLRQVIKSDIRRKRHKHRASHFELLVGSSSPMQTVYSQIAKAAPTDATIMIVGQSGTGKELVARSIHNRSKRSEKRFVAINCGAIPDSLIESELFGAEKGAYTGADKMRKGVFERAQNGTLFLDEITEMAMDAQTRLLRVLEERAVTRVGGDKAIKLNVRVIAATNRDPHQAINDGQLREDLHYRLAVFPMQLPRLMNRGDDATLLAKHFLAELNNAEQTQKSISEQGVQRIRNYDWPGNVRQLRNMIYRAYIMEEESLDMHCLDNLILDINPDMVSSSSTEQLPETQSSQTNSEVVEQSEAKNEPVTESQDEDGKPVVTVQVGTTLEETERQLILSTLKECDNNRTQAAKKLGISIKTLYNRLQKYESEEDTD